MADIRINSLPSTATSFNTDDYIPIDGASGGTRKMLAATLPLTDVKFGGASGPSAKSSIAARAARQGLVFDGTNTASVTLPAFGTGDFAFSFWQNVGFNANGYGTMIGGGLGALVQNFDGSGRLQLIRGDGVGGSSNSTSAVVVGKWEHWVISRASGVVSWYKNGVSDGSSTCTADFTGTAYSFGRGGSYLNTGVVIPYVYNRALSAAEVVSLYEAGVPSGADYNNASNTNAATNWSNSGVPYTTFSGGSATGFTATSNGVGNQIAAISPSTFPIVKGTKWRVTCTLTLNSGTAPSISFGSVGVGNLASNVQQLSAGSNTFELTVTQTTSTSTLYCYNLVSASNFSISGFSLTPLGLLLAPDAAQAGGGLTWYDTSGNAANITLPASGVTWNVPSSLKTASGWTYGGDLTVAGTGTSTFGGWLKIDFGNPIFLLNESDQVANSKLWGLQSEGSQLKVRAFNDAMSSAVDAAVFTRTGNVLVGGTIDGGQKFQVAGTALFAGSINDALLYWKNTDATGYTGVTLQNNSGTGKGGIGYANASASFFADSVYMYSAGSLRLATGGTTTALTLDSSQRTILSGALRLANTYVATPQVSTGYVTIQDSTGTTYKVLVAP